jgi:N-acetylmuramoyl-L-alanine amidase
VYRDQIGSYGNGKRGRENRTRNGALALGVALVVVFLVFFVRGKIFSEGDGAAGKELWPDAHDPARPVFFDETGKRVIQWEKIQVPEWIVKDLLPVNEFSRPGTFLDDVAGIVIHYTANPGTTAWQNRNYFAGLSDGTAGTYVSSHFIIGIDGTIIQCVPMSEVAYASNDRNYDTVSIECCHEEESGKFSKETYASLVKLTAWLSDTYMIETEDIIRHYDVTGKACPKYFVDYEDKWEKFLLDVEKNRK